MYGVNALDIWDLPDNYFFSMTRQVDVKRKKAKKK